MGKYYELGEKELEFARIVWENEPIASGELVKLCEEKLRWKKSTTYTVLKKLCNIGYFENSDSIVTSRISHEKYRSMNSHAFVLNAFSGSLPSFLAAFVREKRLSRKEIEDLKKLIDEHEEEYR
ncbi:MAG: BlaI/MecI/CopY family transcriptional regulator [Peptostreptococcaceae bacterium]|nr:BlaI/MecI/CopY family transcriptional regulator [Peptostreptococcaceae bacterium]